MIRGLLPALARDVYGMDETGLAQLIALLALGASPGVPSDSDDPSCHKTSPHDGDLVSGMAPVHFVVGPILYTVGCQLGNYGDRARAEFCDDSNVCSVA